MRFKFCKRFALHGIDDETYLTHFGEAPSFFKKQNQFTKIARSVVLGGIPLSTYAVVLATLVHGAFSPWLLLMAIPYLSIGTNISYAISEPATKPRACKK